MDGLQDSFSSSGKDIGASEKIKEQSIDVNTKNKVVNKDTGQITNAEIKQEDKTKVKKEDSDIKDKEIAKGDNIKPSN